MRESGTIQESLVFDVRFVWASCLIIALFLATPPAFTQFTVAAGQPLTGGPGAPAAAANAGVQKYIVQFVPGTPRSTRAAAAQQAGAAVRYNYAIIDAMAIQVPNENALARLRNNPLVVNIVPARPVYTLAKGGNNRPNAPDNLVATPVSSSQIDLTWNDNSDNEAGFQVERCQNAGCSTFGAVASLPPDATAFSDTGLSGGTVYQYRVRANSAKGPNSDYSNIAEAQTHPDGPPPPSTPAAPSNLTVTGVSTGYVDIGWVDNADNEDDFRIERCEGSGCGSFSEIATVAADLMSYRDTAVIHSTSYVYRVRASNSSGFSDYSNTALGTTSAEPPPPPPPPPSSGGTRESVPIGVQRTGAPTELSNGSGVGIAVLDSGIDLDHPDLTVAAQSFNAFPEEGSCDDLRGHGTHVGGIAAARQNNMGVVGVAPNATLYCAKVLSRQGIGDDADIIAGLDWVLARHNDASAVPTIRVANLSLGREAVPEDFDINAPLRAAVKRLYDDGVAVVAAAGNQRSGASPSDWESSDIVPAGFPEVIPVAGTVAETGSNGCDPDTFGINFPAVTADSASLFTVDGPAITVSAPSEERNDTIQAAEPFFGSPVCYFVFHGIYSTTIGGGWSRVIPAPDPVTGSPNPSDAIGTSFAAPHVSGIVARLIQTGTVPVPSNGSGVDMIRQELALTADRSNSDPSPAPTDHPWAEFFAGSLIVTPDGVAEGIGQAPN